MNKFIKIKLKYIADIFNGNSIPDEEKCNYTGKLIPYIPTKEIDINDGKINYDNGLSVNIDDDFRIAPSNSVLMCIEGGSAGKKIGITDRPVAFVNKLCCINGITIDSKYLLYAIKSKDFMEQFFLNITGLIGGVTTSVLKNLYVTIPSNIEHQNKIILFLESKCRVIDELIENLQSQIKKIKEYKQSVILETVMNGVNSNSPLQNTNVEWIGKIPNHWRLCRIKDLYELRNERNYEDLDKVNLISLYTDLGVVQHSDIKETTGNKAVTADGYKKVYKNDIIVNIILCWMGAIGRSNFNGVTSPAYDVYKPKHGTYSNYYHYLFRTSKFNGECYRYGRGIMMMRWRTYSTEFSSMCVPFPPIEEQIAIVNYLDEKCSRIDEFISIKENKIEELKEYKNSLIFEYITGKKEVSV